MLTDGMSVAMLEIGGLRFASGAELAFALLMAVPLAFFVGCVLYLWRLLLTALPARGRIVRLAPPQANAGAETLSPHAVSDMPMDARQTRFLLLLPAHNEELVLETALTALRGLDYPAESYRIVVIADNCTDRTAEIARAQGAVVLERFNKVEIGKGYALEWALQTLLCAPELAFDAVVILDADTVVSPNLLTAFAEALQAGDNAMQARYEVLNTGESWRTKLMACALALAHIVKPLGREQRKLSDGLKGNGMCFARKVVEQVPWSGTSITEDIEYTLRLCRAGFRVAFLPNAAVWAQMPTTGAQATSQRQRWEGGRYRLLFQVAPALLSEGFRSRNRLLWDRALELIVPPFAELFALPLMFLCLSALLGRVFGWTWAQGSALAWGVILFLQAGYLFLGLWVARVPASVALALLCAPFYIVWKFGVYALMVVGRSAGGWKRTERRQM